jgi:hypothetical protein
MTNSVSAGYQDDLSLLTGGVRVGYIQHGDGGRQGRVRGLNSTPSAH